MDTLHIYRRRLPHWRADGTHYFVTFRIASGTPDLNDDERTVVMNALRFFDDKRYRLWAAVVMNDHVHALVWPMPGHELTAIVQSWKSFTANRLQREHRRREGRVWQDEYMDRGMRNELELHEKATYIMGNPSKRFGPLKDYEWLYVAGPAAVVGRPHSS